jgi:hypothetical protein
MDEREEHSIAYLKEWYAGLSPEKSAELEAKFNTCSWVSDKAIGNFPDKPKKIHLEKLFQLAQ